VDEGWLERDGVRLHYLRWWPAGPPREPALLLLHGLSSNARVWERMAALLPDRRIVALDQRSHGQSDRPASGHALQEVVADAAHAVAELGLGRPLVAGHSWGATVALSLATTHPDRTSGLVVVDGGTMSFSRLMTWEEAASRMQPPLPSFRDLDEAAAEQATDLGDAWADDLRGFVRAGLVDTPDGGLASTLTAGARLEILRDLYDFQPELLFADVRGPILLAMAGLLWPGAPAEMVERRRRAVDEVRELRPDAQVRWYESRHDVPLIRPAELAADVERTAIAAALGTLAWEAAALVANPGLDWSRPAHGDGGGWDSRELLAHLSSTQAALPAIIAAPARAGDGGGERAPFDPDRWNASQLRRRAERRPAELADELLHAAERAQVALMDADLGAETTIGSFTGLPLRDALEAMLRHQRGHLAEVERTLNS
jgi:pimeloyl-ACP methyl ester carboxylesterase